MDTLPLQDDFIAEFRAEQAFVRAQIARFDPLTASLRRRSVAHFLGTGVLLFLEVALYVGIGLCIALFVFREKLYPFYLLTRFRRPEFQKLIGVGNVANLQVLIWTLVGIISLLLFILARNLRSLRHKNAALARTGSTVKTFLGELLQRKSAQDALEQRHYAALPMTDTYSSVVGVNDVPNPGY